MAAAARERRTAYALAASCYCATFGALLLFEQPGLGIGHFFYVPVCVVALVSDELRGALAGMVAGALYALAVVLMPHAPAAETSATASVIRAVTYIGAGTLVGWFASRNRTLVAELRQRTLEDFLTGIGNARSFDEELARRCTLGRPFTLVVADLDDFGTINDTHGHDAGNAALRAVANALREAARPGDVVARVGGDEFGLVTSMPVEQAALFCARITRTIAGERLSLSFGTTSFPDDGTTAVELFRKADDRLFAAKLVSRNRRTVVALS